MRAGPFNQGRPRSFMRNKNNEAKVCDAVVRFIEKLSDCASPRVNKSWVCQRAVTLRVAIFSSRSFAFHVPAALCVEHVPFIAQYPTQRGQLPVNHPPLEVVPGLGDLDRSVTPMRRAVHESPGPSTDVWPARRPPAGGTITRAPRRTGQRDRALSRPPCCAAGPPSASGGEGTSRGWPGDRRPRPLAHCRPLT